MHTWYSYKAFSVCSLIILILWLTGAKWRPGTNLQTGSPHSACSFLYHFAPLGSLLAGKLGTSAASYPDVSLLMKMCAQRKAGRRQLPSVPFPWSLALHHQSLVSGSPLPREKRSAWGGGWHFSHRATRLENSKTIQLLKVAGRRKITDESQCLTTSHSWPPIQNSKIFQVKTL